MPKTYQPKKPPCRNNHGANYFIFIITFMILIIYATYFSENGSFSMALLYLAVTFVPIIFINLGLFVREIFLSTQRDVSVSNQAIRSIPFSNWPRSLVAALIIESVFLYCLPQKKHPVEVQVMIRRPMIDLVDVIVALIIIFLGHNFKWYETPITESDRQKEPLSLNMGSCMAIGFFYGYLKLISKELPKKIQDFIDNQKIKEEKMPVKKLFILIPSSAQVLNNPYQPNIKAIDVDGIMEPHQEDRGMVKRRIYKHTVYEIKDKENKLKYILPVEYASPLKTFYEFIDSLHGSKFKEYIPEVVSSFYYTLEKILNEDKEVKDRIELIYYNDEKAADLSTIVKKRIKYLMKKN